MERKLLCCFCDGRKEVYAAEVMDTLFWVGPSFRDRLATS
jgi:hypothetical protein